MSDNLPVATDNDLDKLKRLVEEMDMKIDTIYKTSKRLQESVNKLSKSMELVVLNLKHEY